METLLNDGYCPECQLNNEDVTLLLNRDDFWECPKSHLQLAVNGVDAVILKFRAIGQFRSEPTYGTKEINGAILTRSKGNSIFTDQTIFNSHDELREYLLNEVEPPLEFSLQNLAETYAKYKYGNPFTNENNPLTYKRQSKYFKIDFENSNIIKKLEKRDSEEERTYPYYYTHLYRLLLSLFEKYYNGDASWLPEMGMSQIEVDLCKKYFDGSAIEEMARDIVKKKLFVFIVDLIKIIYQGNAPSFTIEPPSTVVAEQQKDFLRLHLICGHKYDHISKELGVPRATLTTWYETLRAEREHIAKIRVVWSRKKFTPVFEDFYKWYEKLERKCHYCHITETQIAEMVDNGKLTTKRLATRGRRLEYDRKDPNLTYDLSNIVLCCYWCNNAKTDTFSYDEFLKVGEQFKLIWQNRLLQ
ncbi:hypothetical protein [Adhaeribacter soli]|uniref:Uncharacterized protein n=1 Tax=Adhaeribacter soli TaxID=2607655 RepID=A0A5N1IRQ7_9BACT|nr:hypothetical protein [Adhaeribacter soli]KAA9332677.1 hypothetical protein F0P94_11760 [Adhaeribacter soli]